MKYRKFRCLDRETSLLGMGAMRFPAKEDGSVDVEASIQLLRSAVDKGVNYIDTAYSYYGGDSERIIGEAMKDGYRERVIIADKLPVWEVEKEEDVRKLFDVHFERLDMDYIDMYLVHNIIPSNWEKTKKYNVLPFLAQMKKEGRIGHIGFSFHGDFDLLKEVLDYFDWEFCQIQLNYVDKNEQATLEGLEYARRKGVDVIVMEPLKGGKITGDVPDSVQAIWDEAIAAGEIPADRSRVEWAFKWVASQPGVTHILSGMSNMQQLNDNVELFSKEDIDQISDVEEAFLDRVAAEFNGMIPYQCTACEYCLPCPSGVGIPDVIDYLNNWIAYGKNPNILFEYIDWMDDKHASSCTHCGACEKKCPQGLPISDIMKKAEEEFGQ